MVLDLTPFLPHLPVWTLVLFRLTGLFVFAPLLGSLAIPLRVKIFLALGLSFCIYPMLLTPGNPAAASMAAMLQNGLSLPGVVAAVAMELLIGLALGFGASIPLVGMQLAGQVADQQLGFGIGGIFNPDLESEVGVMGQFYFLLAMAIFVIAGGHRALLGTLVGSFNHIPLGGFQPGQQFVGLLLGLLNSSFELALRVSAPLLCLVFLETIAMGFLARTVPQINLMSVGFALRILVGSTVLIGALHIQSGVYGEYLRRSLRDLNLFFAGG